MSLLKTSNSLVSPALQHVLVFTGTARWVISILAQL